MQNRKKIDLINKSEMKFEYDDREIQQQLERIRGIPNDDIFEKIKENFSFAEVLIYYPHWLKQALILYTDVLIESEEWLSMRISIEDPVEIKQYINQSIIVLDEACSEYEAYFFNRDYCTMMKRLIHALVYLKDFILLENSEKANCLMNALQKKAIQLFENQCHRKEVFYSAAPSIFWKKKSISSEKTHDVLTADSRNDHDDNVLVSSSLEKLPLAEEIDFSKQNHPGKEVDSVKENVLAKEVDLEKKQDDILSKKEEPILSVASLNMSQGAEDKAVFLSRDDVLEVHPPENTKEIITQSLFFPKNESKPLTIVDSKDSIDHSKTSAHFSYSHFIQPLFKRMPSGLTMSLLFIGGFMLTAMLRSNAFSDFSHPPSRSFK